MNGTQFGKKLLRSKPALLNEYFDTMEGKTLEEKSQWFKELFVERGFIERKKERYVICIHTQNEIVGYRITKDIITVLSHFGMDNKCIYYGKGTSKRLELVIGKADANEHLFLTWLDNSEITATFCPQPTESDDTLLSLAVDRYNTDKEWRREFIQRI